MSSTVVFSGSINRKTSKDETVVHFELNFGFPTQKGTVSFSNGGDTSQSSSSQEAKGKGTVS